MHWHHNSLGFGLWTVVAKKKQMGNPRKPSTADELHMAARSGDLIAVNSILASNPLAVNSRDKHSRTPYPPHFLY